MSRRCRSAFPGLTTSLAALALLALWAAAPVAADPLLINNGLAPPNPANVIDEVLGTYPMFSSDPLVVVRNDDCTELSGPCTSPGDSTTVEIAPGGQVGGAINVYDSSTLAFNGGTQIGVVELHNNATLTASAPVGGVYIQAYEDSSIMIEDGGYMYGLNLFDSTTATIDGYFGYSGVSAYGSSSLFIYGGGETLGATDASSVHVLGGGSSNWMDVSGTASIVMSSSYSVSDQVRSSEQGTLEIGFGGNFNRMLVQDASVVTIAGHDFEVCDGPSTMATCAPVGLGLLSEQAGTLRGTAFSGDALTVWDFRHNGYSDSNGTYTGQIRLVPEPSTGALLALGLAGLAAGVQRRR